MIGQSIHDYYWFGTSVRFLQDASQGAELGQGNDGRLLFNLRRFFEYIDELGLQVTRRAADELHTFFRNLEKRGPEYQLSAEDAAKLGNFIERLRDTLEAEISGLTAFIVTPKRLEVARLLNDVTQLFPPGTFDKLPEIARYDLAEGGKCIAFERPTSAAFHVLRATEGVLRQFYRSLAKQKRVDLLWGKMTTDLARRRAAKPHLGLIQHLDHIRLSFRNPTQHPDKIYDIQEVQDLWSLCCEAIGRMAKAF